MYPVDLSDELNINKTIVTKIIINVNYKKSIINQCLTPSTVYVLRKWIGERVKFTVYDCETVCFCVFPVCLLHSHTRLWTRTAVNSFWCTFVTDLCMHAWTGQTGGAPGGSCCLLSFLVSHIVLHSCVLVCVFVCVVVIKRRAAQGKKADVVTPFFVSLPLPPPIVSHISVSLPGGTVMDGRLQGWKWTSVWSAARSLPASVCEVSSRNGCKQRLAVCGLKPGTTKWVTNRAD